MVCKQLIILFMDGNILNAAAEKTPIEKRILFNSVFWNNNNNVIPIKTEIIMNSNHNFGNDLINSLLYNLE